MYAQIPGKLAHQFKASAADQGNFDAAPFTFLQGAAIDFGKLLFRVHQRSVDVQRKHFDIHFVHFFIQSGQPKWNFCPA